MKKSRFLPTLIGASVLLSIPLFAYSDGNFNPSNPGNNVVPFEDLTSRIRELDANHPHKHKEMSEKEKNRLKLAQTLQTARALVLENRDEEALQKLSELDAISDKSADETCLVERMRLVIASRMGDDALRKKSAEAILATQHATADERLDLEDTLGRMAYNRKDFPQAIAWMTRYFQDGGSDIDMYTGLAKAYYFTADYPHAISEAHSGLDAGEKAEQAPAPDLLNLWIDSALKLQDRAEYIRALEKAAQYYPRKAYWAALLDHVISRPDFPDALSIEVYRLMFAAGDIDGPEDYVNMAQSALESGYPGLARQVVEQGFTLGILGHGTDAAAHKRLREQVARSAEMEAKDLNTEAARIAAGKAGEKMALIGSRLIDQGDLDKGISLLERGLRIGSIKYPDETRLRLGVAYLTAGRKGDGEKMLESVQGRNGSADLARYWMIYFEGKQRSGSSSKSG